MPVPVTEPRPLPSRESRSPRAARGAGRVVLGRVGQDRRASAAAPSPPPRLLSAERPRYVLCLFSARPELSRGERVSGAGEEGAGAGGSGPSADRWRAEHPSGRPHHPHQAAQPRADERLLERRDHRLHRRRLWGGRLCAEPRAALRRSRVAPALGFGPSRTRPTIRPAALSRTAYRRASRQRDRDRPGDNGGEARYDARRIPSGRQGEAGDGQDRVCSTWRVPSPGPS